MAIMCLMKITRAKDGVYHARYQSFFNQSLPASLASDGIYISDVGESERKKGEIIEVALLRGMEYLEEWEDEDGTE